GRGGGSHRGVVVAPGVGSAAERLRADTERDGTAIGATKAGSGHRRVAEGGGPIEEAADRRRSRAYGEGVGAQRSALVAVGGRAITHRRSPAARRARLRADDRGVVV